jgi:hypothetical protein
VPAAVLMASTPPHGMIGSLFGMALTNPRLMSELCFAHHLGPRLTDGRAIERALFSKGMPERLVWSYMRRFQAELDLVILDLLFLDLPPSTPMLDIPVLVLGAENGSSIAAGWRKPPGPTAPRPRSFPAWRTR